MQKILIVDNSALMRRFLCDIINADKDFHVVDMSADGEDAYNKITSNAYDLVVMEMILPKMDGLTILKRLKEENNPCKIIALTTSVREDTEETVKALEYGAYDFVARPARLGGQNGAFGEQLLIIMHNVLAGCPKKPAPPTSSNTVARVINVGWKPEIVFIASSTGGPKALHTVFERLHGNIDVPIVIVQHMPKGFTRALAQRLNQLSDLEVKEAADGDVLRPGCAYIAPGGHHMLIAENHNKQAYLSINDEQPVNSLRPCADVTMASFNKTSYRNILCVVLTGMGADGTEGIREMKKRKKLYVITESQETCVVYGMPRSVVQNNLSNESAPIEKISEAIIKKLGG